MPLSTSRDAPKFVHTQPAEVRRFIKKMETLFKAAGITDGNDKKERITDYVDAQTDTEIYDSYPEASEDTGSMAKLDKICKEHARLAQDDAEELHSLMRKFRAESKKLSDVVGNGVLAKKFLSCLVTPFADLVQARLLTKHGHYKDRKRHKDNKYNLSEIFKVVSILADDGPDAWEERSHKKKSAKATIVANCKDLHKQVSDRKLILVDGRPRLPNGDLIPREPVKLCPQDRVNNLSDKSVASFYGWVETEEATKAYSIYTNAARDTRDDLLERDSMKVVRKETNTPIVASSLERNQQNDWKNKTGRSNQTANEKQVQFRDLPFEKVPGLNDGGFMSGSRQEYTREEVQGRVEVLAERVLSAPVAVTAGELLGVADKVREEVIRTLARASQLGKGAEKKYLGPVKSPDKTASVTMVNINDLPQPAYYIAGEKEKGIPPGAAVHRDCVAAYLEALPPGDRPVVVYVARDLQVL
ncbi:hypothetical protein DXG01_002743 [Tephrocybe rancida]|nr:hypothetical protein DXG01_002743 [Tephrocybe rancida]